MIYFYRGLWAKRNGDHIWIVRKCSCIGSCFGVLNLPLEFRLFCILKLIKKIQMIIFNYSIAVFLTEQRIIQFFLSK